MLKNNKTTLRSVYMKLDWKEEKKVAQGEFRGDYGVLERELGSLWW